MQRNIRVAADAADGTRMYFRRDVESVTAKDRSSRAANSSADRSLRWGGAALTVERGGVAEPGRTSAKHAN